MERRTMTHDPRATRRTTQHALLAGLLAVLGLALLFGLARPQTPLTYAATGGPDSYGYSYADSDEATCTTAFEDISGTGTALGLGDDDETNVTMPFDFIFYGVTSNQLRIANNGGIIFGTTSGDIRAGNNPLPHSTNDFVTAILPFWDDIDDGPGNVYYETRGTAPDRRFIVQWHERPRYVNIGAATFQAVLYEDGGIDFVYDDVDFGNASYDYGAGATIGIQQDSSNALQYSHNTASLNGISAICFSPRLVLGKAADDTVYNPGDTVTFTITASSGITPTVSDGIISDTLPAGLTFVPNSITLDAPAGGSVGTAPPTLASGLTLGEGDRVTMTLQATVDTDVAPGTLITNTATISSATADASVASDTTIIVDDCAARVENEPTIYDTVQEAIDAADPGETVKVAGYCTITEARTSPDFYDGSGTVTQIGLITKSLTLRGGYTTADWDNADPQANPTTLDALGAGRGLLVANAMDVTIEGLRITGGDDSGQGGISGNDSGGGMMVVSATTTISDNMVYDNVALSGGGITLYDADTTVYNTTVMSNTVAGFGGGFNVYRGEILLDGNTIASNTATNSNGGAALIEQMSGTLRNNTIIGNNATLAAGAIRFLNSDLDLVNNMIADNTLANADDTGAGIAVEGSAVDMWHNTLARNTGGDGSGVAVEEVVTIRARGSATDDDKATASPASNRAFAPEGPDYATTQAVPSTVNMTNTILVSHTIGITVDAASLALLDHTLWGADEWANLTDIGGAGTITSTNAITGTPDFVDPASGDYHIGENSAAIDAGTDAGITEDIDGDPRPLEAGFDIGADEFQRILETYLPFLIKPAPTTR